jgi:hypothetical protein
MLQQDELTYIEQEIKEWKRRISYEHFNWIMNTPHGQDLYEESVVEAYLVNGLRHLYFHILAYIEAKKLPGYAQTFKEKYGNRLNDEKFLLNDAILHPDEDPELIVLHEFATFLAPFKAFNYSQAKQEETNRLIEVLKCTPYILKNTKTNVTNETSIYKAVEWALKLYFPTCRRRNKARFIEQFKIYNPDLLIPELKTAIEYKLIRAGKNIEEYIDQIKVDSANYKDDHQYDNFIAVLCIEDGASATEKNIRSSWAKKQFPNNWELVVAFI